MADKDSQTQAAQAPTKEPAAQLTPEELAKQKEKEAEWARREAAFQAQQAEREYQKTNTKLFLSNLPRNYKRGDIENLCQRYGTITQVIINSEKQFAFVTFSSREDAQYALYDLQEKQVGGLQLRVNWSKPSEKEKESQKKEAENAVRAAKAAEPPKPKAGEAAPADKAKEAGAPTAAPEVEKPRFAAQQKPVAKKPPQPKPAQNPAPQKGAQPAKGGQPAQKKQHLLQSNKILQNRLSLRSLRDSRLLFRMKQLVVKLFL